MCLLLDDAADDTFSFSFSWGFLVAIQENEIERKKHIFRVAAEFFFCQHLSVLTQMERFFSSRSSSNETLLLLARLMLMLLRLQLAASVYTRLSNALPLLVQSHYHLISIIFLLQFFRCGVPSSWPFFIVLFGHEA